MRPDLPAIQEIWVYLSGSPLLALILTLSAYQLGVNSYIVKPVDFDRFVEVAETLEHYWTAVNIPPPL